LTLCGLNKANKTNKYYYESYVRLYANRH
jgi:hypothetical protein